MPDRVHIDFADQLFPEDQIGFCAWVLLHMAPGDALYEASHFHLVYMVSAENKEILY